MIPFDVFGIADFSKSSCVDQAIDPLGRPTRIHNDACDAQDWRVDHTCAAERDNGRAWYVSAIYSYPIFIIKLFPGWQCRWCKEGQRPSSRRNRSRSPWQVQFRHLAAVATVKSDSNPPWLQFVDLLALVDFPTTQ